MGVKNNQLGVIIPDIIPNPACELRRTYETRSEILVTGAVREVLLSHLSETLDRLVSVVAEVHLYEPTTPLGMFWGHAWVGKRSAINFAPEGAQPYPYNFPNLGPPGVLGVLDIDGDNWPNVELNFIPTVAPAKVIQVYARMTVTEIGGTLPPPPP